MALRKRSLCFPGRDRGLKIAPEKSKKEIDGGERETDREGKKVRATEKETVEALN